MYFTPCRFVNVYLNYVIFMELTVYTLPARVRERNKSSDYLSSLRKRMIELLSIGFL